MRARRTYSSNDDTGTTISTLIHANECKCKCTQTNANECHKMSLRILHSTVTTRYNTSKNGGGQEIMQSCSSDNLTNKN